MRAALGLKARTGRAIVVALGAGEPPRVLVRAELPLLPAGDFAPYHAAEKLPLQAACESVARSIAAAHRLAEHGLRAVVDDLERQQHAVGGCGLLVGAGMPAWSTGQILAVHVRMHRAEGELFRDVLVAAAAACGLAATTLREKSALDDAASRLGLTRTDLDARLAGLGKDAGAPWGKDQKEAAAAALVALAA